MPRSKVQKPTVETEPAQLKENIQTEAITVETEPAQVQSNIQTKATVSDLAGGTGKSQLDPQPRPRSTPKMTGF